jgi:hypothetical protein
MELAGGFGIFSGFSRWLDWSACSATHGLAAFTRPTHS